MIAVPGCAFCFGMCAGLMRVDGGVVKVGAMSWDAVRVWVAAMGRSYDWGDGGLVARAVQWGRATCAGGPGS